MNDDATVALQRRCTAITENLCETMGTEGCAALLARAMVLTERMHPCLATVRRKDGREIHLDGVAAAVAAHGADEVNQAVTALVDVLVDVLGRLIGEDMALRIIDPQNPAGDTTAGTA